MLLPRAQARIEGQLRDNDALDAKPAVWPRSFDVGPDTRRFYETMGQSTRLAATRQMLSELLAAVDLNDKRVPGKRRLFKAGFAVLVIGLLGALTVALMD